jgi:Amt family ammonium transporter
MDSPVSTDLWQVAAAFCVFLVLAGHVTLESGLVRAKHSVNAAAKALVQAGLSVIVVWAIGYGLMSASGQNGFIGGGPFMPDAGSASSHLLFMIATSAAAGTILSGPLAERTTLRGYAAVVLIFSLAIGPVVAHWVWARGPDGAGWLNQLGFVDLSGGAVIHVAGSAAALTAAAMIGPRTGRFTDAKRTPVIQSQSFPFASLGVLLLWLGWFGIAAGQAMGIGAAPASTILVLVLAGAAGTMATFIANQVLPRQFSVIHIIHGALAGVVAVAAGAHLFNPLAAVLIGALGAAAALGGARLVQHARIDDAMGIASVHLFAGGLGVIAVGLAALPADVSSLLVQSAGVLTIMAWSTGIMAAGIAGARLVLRLRVARDDERIGLNVSEHGMTTDVALLVGQMNAVNRYSGSFAYLDADTDGEIGQVAREYNRAVDIFRAQITGVRDQLDTARGELDESQADNARLSSELAQRDERLEEATREVALLTDQIARALVTMQGLQGLRTGLVRLIGRTFRPPIERLHALARRADASRQPADMDELIEAAREETARLARRLADVIDYAQASTFETPPTLDRTPVDKLIAEVNMVHRSRAEAKGVKLRVVWAPDVAGMVISAATLRKIMSELVENAIETTRPGGLVSLLAKRGSADELIVDVVDSGAGISPGQIAQALDPLADGALASSDEPGRLGLALVKKLVDIHQGTLTVRSKPGVGTQIRATLKVDALARGAQRA